ncbi:MAG: PIG-L family deacetylase [Planctomycetes bacterium]|nr:PIG-L family deacetylase [Planctomycetota bacterium]MCB9884396.1 PIG-L family deacetylase [Planctomycetota bacterium]
MRLRLARAVVAALSAFLCAPVTAQTWQETCGRSSAGTVDLEQTLRDIGRDALVLLVASHPDDRYVLPAAWLRHCHGVRVAVLLATRGGGGQNSTGPETGDALERIRTLETEAGCARFDAEVWYLNRPDAGFRRSAVETFADWGRESTRDDVVRLLRTIRPDVVMTTHHNEEAHGHDLAVVEVLTEAVRLAADAQFAPGLPPHAVSAFYLGAGGTNTPRTLRVSADRWDEVRGATLRRLAHDVLREAHISPGTVSPMDTLFESELRLEPQTAASPSEEAAFLAVLPSLFDAARWPGDPARGEALSRRLSTEIPELVHRGAGAIDAICAALGELRQVRAALPKEPSVSTTELRARLARRIAALERLLLLVAQVQLELQVPPGTYAVAGEDLSAVLQVHRGEPVPLQLRVEGLAGIRASLEGGDPDALAATERGRWQAPLSLRVPLGLTEDSDPMARRFHADRFVPPVRIRATLSLFGTEVPVDLTAPIEQRAPVRLELVPPMLLLPSGRTEARFSVRVTRNSRYPIDGAIEVEAPAGYVITDDHRQVSLREQRGDLFGFSVRAPAERKAGVDVLRVRLGRNRVALPVHKVEVQIRPGLRVGLLRGHDDTLPGILGASGLGVTWSELSDSDIAVADLGGFHTIVVDVRALRDRPEARLGFRRLLEFAQHKGRRLVVFYHKDIEFHPVGEGFLGAPFAPFQIGKARVTRPDAPVRMLLPQHVLLRNPNIVRLGDWDGWEQERCLYLPEVYSSQYETLLEMQDPDRDPERSALLYARTGQGEYVYCALALWRQLKKLHPGAVRLLANLLTPAADS